MIVAVSARWAPRLLTPYKKLNRLNLSQANLTTFEADQAREYCENTSENTVDSILTLNDCWIHQFEPETNRQLMQWKHLGSIPSKKAKVVSTGKVMTSVFWDAQGITFIDYLHKQGILCENQVRLNDPKKYQKGFCSIRTMRLPTNRSSQWLLYMTVATHSTLLDLFSTTLHIHRSDSVRLFWVSEHEKESSWEALPTRLGSDSCG